MQGVDDELENNCFICGIGKDYLDSVPHGFDIHVQKEHNLANYLYVFTLACPHFWSILQIGKRSLIT